MTTKSFDEFGLEEDILDEKAQENKTRSGLPSIFTTLRAELEKPVDLVPDFIYPVRGREISLRISTDLPLKKLNRWRVAATNRKNGMVDQLLFSRLLIAGLTQCFVISGEDAIMDGEWLNFRHKDVIDSLDALDYHAAIDKFFARDAEVIRCGNEILEKSGYGDEVDLDVDDESGDTDPLA